MTSVKTARRGQVRGVKRRYLRGGQTPVFTVRVGHTRRTALGKGRCQHQAQEVGRSFLFSVSGGQLTLAQFLLQGLVNEEADHGLGDAGVGRRQAPVEAPDPLRPVNVACTLQSVHLLLPSGPEKGHACEWRKCWLEFILQLVLLPL